MSIVLESLASLLLISAYDNATSHDLVDLTLGSFRRPCPASIDDSLGPSVEGCRFQFDFTLYFEDAILVVVPATIFTILAVARAAFLFCRPRLVERDGFWVAKLSSTGVSAALKIAILVVQCLGHGTRSPASVPAAATSTMAALAVMALSSLEHTRALRPSSLMLVYLFMTILFDLARCRTRFIMSETSLATILTADCVIKLVSFALEARGKASTFLASQAEKSVEQRAGPISRTFFFWLISMFKTGYSRSFSVADMGPIDEVLYSEKLSAMFQPLTQAPQGRPILVASLLIDSVLNYQKSKAPRISNGYGLVGASVLVYVGIAVSGSWYWRQVCRLMSLVRGGLVLSIFEKVLRLRDDSSIESTATTLMISDTQRIISAIEYIYEVAAGVLETSLATYLLYRQLGAPCFTILGLASKATCCLCLWVSKTLSAQQQIWLGAMQKRLEVTKRLLDSIKSLKMTGSEDEAYKNVSRLRAHEIRVARVFRCLLAVSVLLSYSMLTLSPLVIFGAYIGIYGPKLDTNAMISSLVLISLVSAPLIHVFQALPSIGSAYGCFKRLNDFILLKEPDTTPETFESPRADRQREEVSSAGADIVLSMKGASFGWTPEKPPLLRDITLDIKKGYLTAIVGRVGSGKTLLMRSLVGESNQLDGSTVIRKDRGGIAYCGQVPWIENLSAKEAWTQHSEGDPKWLDEVQDCCALDDVTALADYSTGTALARVVAAKKDMVLLDDVFSALDRKSRERISVRLMGPHGLFRRMGTTVLFTTHDSKGQLPYLALMYLLFSNASLTTPGHIASFADEVYHIDDQGRLRVSTSDFLGVEENANSGEDEGGDDIGREVEAKAETKVACLKETDQQVPGVNDSTSHVSDRRVFLRYVRAMGYTNAAVFLVFGITFAVTFSFPHVWVQWQLMLVIVPTSAAALHSTLLQATLRAPFAYVSRIDTGSLLNRFNQDLMFIDGYLPLDLFNTCSEFFTAVFEIILIAVVSHHALAALPVLAVILYLIQHVYLRTSKQLRGIDLEWKGYLHTAFGETASGLATIRANGWLDKTRTKFREKLDRSQEPFYLLHMVQRWLQLVLGLVVAGLAVVITIITVTLRDKVAAGVAGVALLKVTTLGSTLTNFIMAWTSLETSLGAISRIVVFEDKTPSEKQDDSTSTAATDENWPQNGRVQIENIFATYVMDKEKNAKPVWHLRGITLNIEPGDRVAVYGRSGSGKSTFLLALLGMIDMPVGRVVVDGVDLSALRMMELRNRFRVISQDNFLDPESTLRQELDPEGQYSDDTVTDILVRCCLHAKVLAVGGLQTQMADAALSKGEAQLFSIAKLVLSESSTAGGGLIILDEATSSDTEIQVEDLMRESLRGKTTISVLHRLDAALKYDKIAVMEKGVLADFGTAGEIVARCDLFASLR
ncbi:hypothetical protein DCS_07913 [Drechmeria coniospora]|uniref:ABC transporter n=1 Tax=Drechmeria coniospora TaxID=98403 RepID=A0A151GFS7_DRECN|nr:hypothetical protein DCS_07913 [Drechmeria coniospora]KYK55948.1 hypothetical protein DCS_07913 [Drechmeria coniospora]